MYTKFFKNYHTRLSGNSFVKSYYDISESVFYKAVFLENKSFKFPIHALGQKIKNLDPANFAYVMATTIISIILFLLNWHKLSQLFFILSGLGYILLVSLFLERFFLFGKTLQTDLKDIPSLFKYYTFCAGTNELAVRLCYSHHDYFGLALGIIGTVSTLVLTYYIFCAFFVHKDHSIESVSPLWLLMAIANNSVAIIITLLRQHQVLVNDFFLLLAFFFWAFGVSIYVCFMTLNLYRFFFLPLKKDDLSPSYWTCMGAAAIAVVDGSTLITTHQAPEFIKLVTPFIQGSILLLWAWGTFWIPVLLFMGIFKHTILKAPLEYTASFWAMVFPLGMYAFATYFLGQSVDLQIIQKTVPFLMWTAVIAWLFVFALKIFCFKASPEIVKK